MSVDELLATIGAMQVNNTASPAMVKLAEEIERLRARLAEYDRGDIDDQGLIEMSRELIENQRRMLKVIHKEYLQPGSGRQEMGQILVEEGWIKK